MNSDGVEEVITLKPPSSKSEGNCKAMSDSEILTGFELWGNLFEFWGNVFEFWMIVLDTGLNLFEFWVVLKGKSFWLCWILFGWRELDLIVEAGTDWIGNGSSFGLGWLGWTIVFWLDEARGGTSKMDPNVFPWRVSSSKRRNKFNLSIFMIKLRRLGLPNWMVESSKSNSYELGWR